MKRSKKAAPIYMSTESCGAVLNQTQVLRSPTHRFSTIRHSAGNDCFVSARSDCRPGHNVDK